jgi:hypothetical protein
MDLVGTWRRTSFTGIVDKNKTSPRKKSKSEGIGSFFLWHKHGNIKMHRNRQEQFLLYVKIVTSASAFVREGA